MRTLTDMTPEQIIGGYGSDGTRPVWGVLSEHVDYFTQAGGEIRNAASGSGRMWAIVDGRAYPVVCSEIIEVRTEDGASDGRCGLPASGEFGACEAHAEVIASWVAMVEG